MKTLAILTRRQDVAPEAFQRLAKLETDVVRQGMAAGIVRAAHGRADGSGAALGLEIEPAQQARDYLERCLV